MAAASPGTVVPSVSTDEPAPERSGAWVPTPVPDLQREAQLVRPRSCGSSNMRASELRQPPFFMQSFVLVSWIFGTCYSL